MNPRFRQRSEAGALLAEQLADQAGREDVIVLALPRGGVPVGFEVARRLKAPLDVLVVRKLGVPGHEELAMGAIAAGGIEYRDESVIASLQVPPARVAEVVRRERAELARREKAYRGDRPFPPLAGRTVIVVDDGIATGATMRAAVRALQTRRPAAIIVAAPVASESAIQALAPEVTAVVTLLIPEAFFAIGQFYEDFGQTTDQEVKDLLARAACDPT
jgi:putative phosphoribosyl transferase